MKSSINAVILAGGSGTRSGSKKNKTLCYFGAKSALENCLDTFAPFCDAMVVVAAKNDIEEVASLALPYKARVVAGGETRTAWRR